MFQTSITDLFHQIVCLFSLFFQIGGNQGKKSIGTELDAIQVCIACNASKWLICVKAVQPNSLQIFCAQAGVWSF